MKKMKKALALSLALVILLLCLAVPPRKIPLPILPQRLIQPQVLSLLSLEKRDRITMRL